MRFISGSTVLLQLILLFNLNSGLLIIHDFSTLNSTSSNISSYNAPYSYVANYSVSIPYSLAFATFQENVICQLAIDDSALNYSAYVLFFTMDESDNHQCRIAQVFDMAFQLGYGAVIAGLDENENNANGQFGAGVPYWTADDKPSIVIWGEAVHEMLNLSPFTNVSIVPEIHPRDLFLTEPMYRAIQWFIVGTDVILIFGSSWYLMKSVKMHGCRYHFNTAIFAGCIFCAIVELFLMVYLSYLYSSNFEVFVAFGFWYYMYPLFVFLTYTSFVISWAKAVSQLLNSWLYRTLVGISYIAILPSTLDSLFGFLLRLYPFNYYLYISYTLMTYVLGILLILQGMSFAYSSIKLLYMVSRKDSNVSLQLTITKKISISALGTILGYFFAVIGSLIPGYISKLLASILSLLISQIGIIILYGSIFYTLKSQQVNSTAPGRYELEEEEGSKMNSEYMGWED